MSAELTRLLLHSAMAISAMMVLVWLLSLWLRDASIVDIVWGLGFAIVAWTGYLNAAAATRGAIVPMLTTLWGTRLSAYLLWRNHGKAEDFRYQAMRNQWGAAFPIVSLLTVFTLQGMVMWVVSLPVQLGAGLATRPMGPLTILGILVWALGLAFESIADWQLARFKSNRANAGRVLDQGLWRLTRHPNYFGDFLVWWGLYLVAVSVSGAWWTIIGPLVMSVLLMRISGVTLLERTLKETKPGYADYVARTNAFFPGRPRRASNRT